MTSCSSSIKLVSVFLFEFGFGLVVATGDSFDSQDWPELRSEDGREGLLLADKRPKEEGIRNLLRFEGGGWIKVKLSPLVPRDGTPSLFMNQRK